MKNDSSVIEISDTIVNIVNTSGDTEDSGNGNISVSFSRNEEQDIEENQREVRFDIFSLKFNLYMKQTKVN